MLIPPIDSISVKEARRATWEDHAGWAKDPDPQALTILTSPPAGPRGCGRLAAPLAPRTVPPSPRVRRPRTDTTRTRPTVGTHTRRPRWPCQGPQPAQHYYLPRRAGGQTAPPARPAACPGPPRRPGAAPARSHRLPRIISRFPVLATCCPCRKMPARPPEQGSKAHIQPSDCYHAQDAGGYEQESRPGGDRHRHCYARSAIKTPTSTLHASERATRPLSSATEPGYRSSPRKECRIEPALPRPPFPLRSRNSSCILRRNDPDDEFPSKRAGP